ncbi:ral guanine nucleotide dissociation stimulator-like 1 isoform X1 [Pipra filicauda]|uniref:Ral guanine nucleotide dissociation stimulator-like 1 isoform X1 n=1 Tax=Pipra filicauda TaxID=649802 RepID=A0A6J2GV56_9PASS|nr:ral guanine nucleotide dissociation stimulator-like 1 isoform X1 [Pipra filicauda]
MKLLWRAKMTTFQDGGEEVEEGAVYNVTLKKVQIQQAANKGARWLGGEGDQLPPEHTVRQYETSKIRAIKAGTLEKLVENLLTAFGDADFSYISIFLSTYRAFASTKAVLELLLDRFGNLETSSHGEVANLNSFESEVALRAEIASVLRAWLDQCSEDFREPPDHTCLLKLLDYLKNNMPNSDMESKVQNLLKQFQNQEAETVDGFCSTSSSDLVDGEELEISNPEEFSSFQDHIVAEQLTYMDVMLFKKVVPYHCLGSIWSQRDKKENKNLAPTVRATITQFNTVTKCVVSTILGTKELKIQQRAKIIEKWIHIAHECRILKNFSSLRAIISALQSNSIYRLKTTWMCVSKDILLMYEELSEIFSDHDNYLTSRELLMKEATSKFANLDSSEKENQKKSQKRLQLQKNKGVMQGTVPYLGTFLTDLIMLDTALQDYVEGGLINFEKRRREFEVIAQIKLLQSSCNSYCLMPDQKFIHWFRSQRHLTEEESYKLSREVEAAADTNILSPKSQKSMVKRISTLFLGTDVITPPKEQPPKSSPLGGSSGESTDSASVSSCEFNHSESEDVCVTPISSPEDPLKKIPGYPLSSCSPDSSTSTPSSGVSPLPSFPTLLPSSDDKSSVGSDKGYDSDKGSIGSDKGSGSNKCSIFDKGSGSDKCSIFDKASGSDSGPVSDRSSGSTTCSTSKVLPVYNRQNGGACIIRVSMDGTNDSVYKSILITNQDRIPDVTQRALLKHNLEPDAVEDYELVQVISEDKELVFPRDANVFYGMNSHVNFDFILRKKAELVG